MVGFQGVQGGLQGGGQVLQLGLFLIGQGVEVAVVGTPAAGMGINAVLDAVQSGHEQGRVAEVGVAGGVRVANFKAAQAGGLGVGGDADDRAAVGGGVAHGDGGLEPGHQPLEGVGAGVGNGAQGVDVLEQAAHEKVGRLAEVGVAVVVRENGLAVFHQQHVDMHPAARLAVHRLGHQGGALAVLQGGVVDDVFNHHGGVGHFGHLAQLGLDLELAGGPHLGVVVLDGNAGGLHVHAHLTAALVGAVEGLSHMVVGLAGDNDSLAVDSAVPVGLLGVHLHTDGAGGDLPGGAVEKIELKLRKNQHGIGNAGVPHVPLGGQNNVPGILIQRAVFRVADHHGVACHGQGGNVAERINHRRVRVGNKDHVALLYHGVAVV